MKKIVIAVLLSGTAFGALAQENAITGKIGTLGVGAEFTRALNQDWNARFGVNAYTFNRSSTEGSVSYDYKLKLQTGGAMFDYFPNRESGFRLTAGGLINGNDLSMTGKPVAANTFTLNGTNTPGISSLTAKVDFNTVAPYIGLGFGDALAKRSRWNFAFDAGFLYQGKPKATLTCSDAVAGSCAGAAANLAAEQTKLQDALNNFKWYPVISIGASYQF